MAEDPKSAWNTVYCTREYHPHKVGGARNPNFRASPGLDGRLLDFKSGNAGAIKLETADLAAALNAIKAPNGAILLIVPGHQAAKSNSGKPLSIAVETLAADGKYVARVDALLRTSSVSKLARGGNRDAKVHLDSMSVTNAAELKGKTVIVIDDTVTTEGSISAARELLMHAGATVAAIAIARTVKYY